MSKNVMKLLLTLALFSVVACGGKGSKDGDGDGGNNISNSKFKIIDGEIEEENGNIKGSGQLVFNTSLGSTDAEKSFSLAAELKDGSSVTAHIFAGTDLADGINLEYKRNGDKVEIRINGAKLDETLAVSDSGAFSVVFEAHNKESPTHLIIENEAGDDIFDSGSGDWGQGGGKYWGLTLKDATVSKASASKARKGH